MTTDPAGDVAGGTIGLPAGLTWRRASPAADAAGTAHDVEAVYALLARSGVAAVGEPDVTRDEVAADLDHPSLDRGSDTWLVTAADGTVAGYGFALDDNAREAFVDVYVDPTLPDDQAERLASWLAEQGLRRAAEFAARRGASDVVVTSGCYRNEPRLGRALRSAGLAPVRVFWRMRVELGPEHADPGVLPEGVTLRRIDPRDQADLALALRLRNATFAEHFGHVDLTLDEYRTAVTSTAWFDPTQWWVAEAAGDPVGLLVGDTSRSHVHSGYVRTLGVMPRFRGRGLGRALLRRAFAESLSRGMEAVELGVDSGNETGAVALYESAGMHPTRVVDLYTTTVAAPRAAVSR